MSVSNLANGAVTTGFSYPVVAKYTNSGGVTTYSNGMDLARGVSVDVTVETAGDDNIFFANNAAAEEAPRRFKRGSAKLTVDGLLRAAEDLILGATTEETVTVGSASVKFAVNDDDQEIPYVGIGVVLRRQSAGQEFFQGLVYTKSRFAQFAPSASTEDGDDIDWQTQELDATLLRDDTPKHAWQKLSEPLETELEAYNAIRVVLGLAPAQALPGNGAQA